MAYTTLHYASARGHWQRAGAMGESAGLLLGRTQTGGVALEALNEHAMPARCRVHLPDDRPGLSTLLHALCLVSNRMTAGAAQAEVELCHPSPAGGSAHHRLRIEASPSLLALCPIAPQSGAVSQRIVIPRGEAEMGWLLRAIEGLLRPKGVRRSDMIKAKLTGEFHESDTGRQEDTRRGRASSRLPHPPRRLPGARLRRAQWATGSAERDLA